MDGGCFFLQRTGKEDSTAKFEVIAAFTYWDWNDQYFCLKDKNTVRMADGCNVACVLVELRDQNINLIDELDPQ